MLQNSMSISHQYKYLLLFITTYAIASYVALEYLHSRSGDNVNKHFGNTTLLVVAHPDDETMFFGPTIINLLRNNKSLVILCLTNGNPTDVGLQREQELGKVVEAFGSAVTFDVIRDPSLPDSLTIEWDIKDVIRHIEKMLTSHQEPIETLLTFDDYGVSGHTNHRSIYRAASYLKANSKQFAGVDFLMLKSIPLWRKYTFFLDSLATIVTNDFMAKSRGDNIITLGVDMLGHIPLKQILSLHHSQMVWFRQLYMIFSRYMYLNDIEYMI